MKESIQKFHSLTLATYTAQMHEDLIYPHHVQSDTVKQYTFENENEVPLPPLRGYFAMKEIDGVNQKYFITPEMYALLPIRVVDYKELFFRESSRSKGIIHYVTSFKEFKIKPEKMFDTNKQFLDALAPFEHSMPLQWELNKIVALMGYIGKTYLGICSKSEFGKSSIYLLMDALTQQCPVFQPRSVPGVLAQITGQGNMVFDEVHEVSSEVKGCMENFSLQVAGNSPVYINGALRSKNTKPQYDVSQQSITYLYNVLDNYGDDKQFWNYIWKNRKAMESRFLCLKFEGQLLEKFDKSFDVPSVARENRDFYISIAKHLLYLKDIKFNHLYNPRWQTPNRLTLKGRHLILYDELLWGIDVFSETQEDYSMLVESLNNAIKNYTKMLHGVGDDHPQQVFEEYVR